MSAAAVQLIVDYCAEGCILVWWSLSDIHTLPPVPGTVRIPGEDALPATLIISAVSYWDLHQFRERGNIKLALWKRDDKTGDRKEVPQIQLLGYYFHPESSLSDPDLNTAHLAFLNVNLIGISLPQCTDLSRVSKTSQDSISVRIPAVKTPAVCRSPERKLHVISSLNMRSALGYDFHGSWNL